MFATLALKMARVCEMIDTDHQYILPMVVCGAGDDELAGNGLTVTE